MEKGGINHRKMINTNDAGLKGALPLGNTLFKFNVNLYKVLTSL